MTDKNENPVTDITEKIASGQSLAAKRALTRAWREAVPDLPVRFAVILVRLNEEGVSKLIQRMKKSGSLPGLKLIWHKNKIEVWTSRGKSFYIGDLPSSDALMLSDLGDQAKKYRPKLIEISTNDDGSVDYLAIELIRPETVAEKKTSQTQTPMIEAIEEIAENIDNVNLDLDQS